MRRGLPLLAWLCVPTTVAAQFSPEVQGRVRDARSGSPIAGAEVSAEAAARVITMADGTFRLRLATPGRVTLSVRHIGHAPTSRVLDVENGRVSVVEIVLEPVALRLPELIASDTQPGSGTTVVTRAQLERLGARDAGEALQQVTGVVVTQRGGAGAPATIALRGASADQTLVLVDGLPVNAALDGAADLSSIPAESIERITVVRGAQSARYGPQALAGVVLVETRRADRTALDLAAEGAGFGGRIGTLRATHRSADGVSLALDAGWQRADNRFDVALPPERGGGSAIRQNADTERRNAGLRAGWEGARGRVLLRGDVVDQDRGMPGALVQPSLLARQDDRRRSLQAAGDLAFGAWRLDGDIGLQTQRTRWRDQLPPFGTPYDDDARLRTLAAHLGAATVAGAWQFAAGADGRTMRLRASALTTTAPTTLRTGGAWLSAGRTIGGDGPWRAAVDGQLRADGATLAQGVTMSPRVHARVARARAGLDLAIGQGFSPPSPADLFFQDGVQVRPNPSLRPERVALDAALTAAVRGAHTAGLTVDAALTAFTADVDGLILWSPDFRFVWSPVNVDVRRRGLEGELRLARADRRAALALGAAHTAVEHARSAFTGQVPYRPRWSAQATLEARIARTDLAGAVRWIGTRRTGFGSDLNALGAFALADLRAQRRLVVRGTALQLRVGVDNVFGRQAAMLPDFPIPGRTWRLGIAVTMPGAGAAALPTLD
jgi:outer membrane cobalamin receptor